MPTPSTSALVRDVNSVPIPQAWNPTNGDFEQLQSLVNILCASPYPDSTGSFAYPLQYTSGALESGNVIKNTGGVLYQLFVSNTNATGGPFYLQFFDATALPATSTASLFSIILPLNTTQEIDLKPFGRKFTTGIVIVTSTTPTTYTAATNTFIFNAFGA